jgi:hypothetical protein
VVVDVDVGVIVNVDGIFKSSIPTPFPNELQTLCLSAIAKTDEPPRQGWTDLKNPFANFTAAHESRMW